MANLKKVKISELSFGLRLDPEFYQDKFIDNRKSLSIFKMGKIKDLAIPRSVKYGIQASTSYQQDGVNYIRGKNLKENGIEGEILKINKSEIPNNEYLLSVGDLLFVRSGNCGDVGVIDSYYVKSSFGSYVIKASLRRGEINPFFAYIFFKSCYGRMQIEQIKSGSVQPNLSIPYIENLLEIPMNINSSFQDKIGNIVLEGFNNFRLSHKIYPEVEMELLDRMGWGKIDTRHILDYTVSKGSFLGNMRLDPEFYQPKFANLLRHLRKFDSKRLGDFCEPMNRGIQPEYVDGGDALVINSKHLGRTEIDIENAEKTSKEFYDDINTKKARLCQYDVLMYSTGAYVGRTNVYLENFKGIASNHVTIIRPDSKVCNPVYLALFLNSPAGLMQTDQRASGSAQREIYPQDIEEYQVFIPQNKDGKTDLIWQKKLADKVVQANQAKKEAKQKLQEAKDLVEREVEKMLGRKGQ